MASSSGDNVMGISGAMNDRFRSLSDALAHRILSFVNVDEFVSVMLVSKRFNKLCLSAPCLSMVNKSCDDSSHRAQLESFFSAYFSRRRQYGYKVQRLRILWSFHQTKAQAQAQDDLEYGRGKRRRRQGKKVQEEYRHEVQKDCDASDPVFRCLYLCGVCCDPEHVELNLILREGRCERDKILEYVLQRNKISEYCFGTFIRNLVLSTNNTLFKLDHTIDIFSKYGFPSRLESLILKSVRISCNSTFCFGMEQFPKLKKLCLYDCDGKQCLKIWNNSLEHVEIVNEKLGSDLSVLQLVCSELKTLILTWFAAESLLGVVDLHLPKLEHLGWMGYPLVYTNSTQHTIHRHMKSATIYCTQPSPRRLACPDKYHSFVAQCLRCAKSLRLLSRTIEVFAMQFNEKIDAFSSGVETLHIDDCYLSDIEVRGVAAILRMMPYLKNIYVSSTRVYERIPFKNKNKVKACIPQEESGIKLDYLEALNLKSVQQLETATVEIHKEQGNSTELIKYFAKHGEHLENLKVICPSALVSTVSSQIDLVKSKAMNVIYEQPTTHGNRALCFKNKKAISTVRDREGSSIGAKTLTSSEH